MIRYFKFVPVLLSAALLSCNLNKDKSFADMAVTATFEAAELPAAGFVRDKSYTEHVAKFENVYDETYDYWHGFAVSSCTDAVTASSENQYSVYGRGGANGSEKFGVCYYDGMEPSTVRFGIRVDMKDVWVNNSTYAALVMRDGNRFARKFEAGDWFKLTIAGYADDALRGSVDFFLADFRDGKTFICNEWTRMDLSPLKGVNRLDFTIDSSDKTQEWINTPAYACIDDLAYGYRIEY